MNEVWLVLGLLALAIYVVLVLGLKGSHPADETEAKTLDQLWQEYVAEHPDTRTELQKQLDRDWLLYGNIFLKRNPDGSIERIDPSTIRLVIDSGGDVWDPRTPQAYG